MTKPRLFPEDVPPRIFPAIDLRDGRCVRLVRGQRNAEIHYGDDPVAIAHRWREEGAGCLHVIDLGAAFGEPDSIDVVLTIARELDIPVQTGGGIRDEGRIARLLEGGVARVILGTRAFLHPDFLARAVEQHGPRRIVVGFDCDGDRIKVSGWEEESPLDIDGGLRLVKGAGVVHLLVTAIDRDGTLSGSREDLIRRVLGAGGVKVVAAGGIGELDHIRTVLGIEHAALEGVVVGRALYEGTVDLKEALTLTGENDGARTE